MSEKTIDALTFSWPDPAGGRRVTMVPFVLNGVPAGEVEAVEAGGSFTLVYSINAPGGQLVPESVVSGDGYIAGGVGLVAP